MSNMVVQPTRPAIVFDEIVFEDYLEKYKPLTEFERQLKEDIIYFETQGFASGVAYELAMRSVTLRRINQ